MIRVAAMTLALAALAAPDTGAAQLFRSPVTCADCIGYYYHFDHRGQDYNCGNLTYGDHRGTDYSLRFGNQAIDGNLEVVAMAAGTVVKTEDGYFDRCTQCGGLNCGLGYGNGFANQVVIEHGAHRTIYGHMKMDSIAVQPGDTVECGQVIGFIGSSGCSTGAHLHIEPNTGGSFGGNSSIDSYEGACSPTPESLFVDQGAYRGLPSAQCDDGPPVAACPQDTYAIWTCDEARTLRRRCVDGVVSDEPCEWGCSTMAAGSDDVCAMPPDADGDGSRADVDCDDANPTAHPGALDSCGDGIDQDCSGADAACPPPVDMQPPPAAGPFVPDTAAPAAPTGSQANGVTVAGSGSLAPTQAGAAGIGASSPFGQPVPQPSAAPGDDGGCTAVHGQSSPPPGLLLLVAAIALLRRRSRT